MQLIIIMALSAFWLTSVLRRLPWIESRAMAGVKPWACNACMSSWTSVPAFIWLVYGRQLAQSDWPHLMAAAGLCLLALELLEPPPPVLPPPPVERHE